MNRPEVDKINRKKSATGAAGVFDSIHVIMHLFRSAQYRAVRDAPYELTHMEGKILAFFARHKGATLSDLVAHTGRDKGQLARLIKNLKSQDLLEARGDEKDRRSMKLHLTPQALAIHRSLERQVERLSGVAISGMDDQEVAILSSLLERIRENLEAEAGE